MKSMPINILGFLLFALVFAGVRPGDVSLARTPSLVQPWGLPADIGPVEKFADVSNTPQGQFLEGGAFDDQGNLWFVAIGTGWVSYLTPDAKLVPVFNCNPPAGLGQTCEPQGKRWHDGKLYLTTRHRGILVYDPQTKQVTTLVYTYRNQLFKRPNMADATGAVYQYSRDGVLRRVMDSGLLPNGDAATTNFAFGGPDDQVLYFEGATSGTFWRFKAPYPGLIGPGGVRLPAR